MLLRKKLSKSRLIWAGWFFCAWPAYGQSLVSVDPNHAEVGSSTEITISGDSGSFFTEDAQVVFDPAGQITHGPVFLTDLNVLHATITIPANLSPSVVGMQDVWVWVGDLPYSGIDLFEVVCPSCLPARILSVEPSAAVAGSGLKVTVIGQDTNFDETSVLIFSGTGIVVGPATASDQTTLQANIIIDASAELGNRTVVANTGAEEARGENLFHVLAPPLILDPAYGTQGDRLANLTITGGPGGYSSRTEVDLGTGVVVGSFESPDGVSLVLYNVSIAVNAPVGPHKLTLSLPALEVSGAFRVLQGPDTRLLSITPDHGDRWHPGLPASLMGQNTHFDEDPALFFSAPGVLATSLGASDQTRLNVVLLIAGSAPEGPTDVTVALGKRTGCTSCERVTLTGGFTITSPGALTSVEPQVLDAGQNATIAIAATDGYFAAGETTLMVDPPDGVEVATLNVADLDHLTAELRISENARGNPRGLRAVTGTEVAVGFGLIDIFHPEILSLAPPRARRGATGVQVAIAGMDIPFEQNTQVLFSGAGVWAESVDFDPAKPDQIKAAVSVAEEAPFGPRDVTVKLPSIEVTAKDAFLVYQLPPPPNSEGCSSCGSGPDSTLSALGPMIFALFRRRRKVPAENRASSPPHSDPDADRSAAIPHQSEFIAHPWRRP